MVSFFFIYNLIFFLDIRGGLKQVDKRYAKANNEGTLDHDTEEEKSKFVYYQDCKYKYYIYIYI